MELLKGIYKRADGVQVEGRLAGMGKVREGWGKGKVRFVMGSGGRH